MIGEYDGGCTLNVDMVLLLFVDKENFFNDILEMVDLYGDLYGVSLILVNVLLE